jgi:hypothetical protein
VKDSPAGYIEFGTDEGQNVMRSGHIDRDAIVGLATTGHAADGAVTIDATTAR